MITVTEPVTKEILVSELKKLGVSSNQILEVHSSLNSFDYVIGGARTIVDALMELSGDTGTLLMPTQTSDNSEPSDWENPAIAPELYKTVRNSIPPYNASLSDIPWMGEVVENFRHRDGVIISNHPHVSYAAWGRYAKLLCNRQSLHFALAEESPAARLYELKGNVLLFGVDFDKATCMHLAEYRCDARPIKIEGACVQTENGPKWKKYLDLDIDSDVFIKVRQIMQRKNMVKQTMIGGCRVMYFSASAAIDEATRYLERTQVYELYR
jgi:aminoglycoside 3-N-acetyltransferase